MDTNKLSYYELNSLLNILDKDGKLQLDADKQACRKFFLDHVNQNTVFFHDLKEKIDYLIDNEYYEKEFIGWYHFSFIKQLYKRAYAKKFRFKTFMGALKYYQGYTLKTFDGQRYLERYEDRCCAVSLYLARGNEELAISILDEIMSGRYQPATPTFNNAGKKQRGEMVSCFLVRTEDSMLSISRTINAALQLSARGGGVAVSLTNLREAGSPIKHIQNASTGVVPVMKILENSFSYANQLGQRDGAGVVYLHAHHPDIMAFLDTKKENADEKIRIKTLSLGVIIPDITFELAKKNEDMYLFSPYDIQRVYGRAMSDISITEMYDELVNNSEIRKKKVPTRLFFQRIAEIQFESGYPYILFEDNANRAHNGPGRINMSNLCSEILQFNEPSSYNFDLSYKEVGKDISCNLGSLNINAVMEGDNFEKTVTTAIRALNTVSDLSHLDVVPSIANGNSSSHAIGLGQMNLHGFLAKNKIEYGSDESIDFVSTYFATVAYYAVKASMEIAKETGIRFDGFEESKYATGEYFDKYTIRKWHPTSEKVAKLFKGINLPLMKDWLLLKKDVQQYGMYNKYLQAVPPTGSISYINNSTASIHPIAAKIEVRKEGSTGRVYYPAPFMNEDNISFFKDAYEIGPEKIINVYAAAQEHVDQGLSLTLFFPESATTRDINRIQGYAWSKGIKTLYYIRVKKKALEGTELEGCVSCSL